MMGMDIVYWDHSYNKILLINLAMAIALFTSIRLFSGRLAHIDSSKELFTKDNPAFGISLASVLFAVTIMLTGVLYSEGDINMLNSAIATGAYGLAGIILMAVTRIIFDKIALPDISLRDEIRKGNIAVAIADAGNVIAAAIIIRSIMIWISDNSIEGIVALLAGYAISQGILTAATYIRRKVFSFMYVGWSIQEELQKGNTALALSFAGRKIGTAFAISIAANIIAYELYTLKTLFFPWALVCVVMILVLKALAFVAERIILFGVDTKTELLEQRNIAVGAMRAVIYISMAILLVEL